MPKTARKKIWPILILIAVLGAIVFGKVYFPEKFQASFLMQKLADLITPQYQLKAQIAELEQENADLKAQIFDQGIMPTSTVKVYSSYPFNNSQYIVLAAGSKEGVSVGDVVTYGKNILVGKIQSVSLNESIAESIFNPNWEMSVRIGSQQVNSLFRGGIELDVTLIPKNTPVNIGDTVVTASQGFPYGLEVGTIQSVTDDVGTPYKHAVLTAPFKLQDLRDVSIVHY